MSTATVVSVADCFIVLSWADARQYTDLFLCLCETTFSDGIDKVLQD